MGRIVGISLIQETSAFQGFSYIDNIRNDSEASNYNINIGAPFHKTDATGLVQKRNYKIRCENELNGSTTVIGTAGIDTGA